MIGRLKSIFEKKEDKDVCVLRFFDAKDIGRIVKELGWKIREDDEKLVDKNNNVIKCGVCGDEIVHPSRINSFYSKLGVKGASVSCPKFSCHMGAVYEDRKRQYAEEGGQKSD